VEEGRKEGEQKGAERGGQKTPPRDVQVSRGTHFFQRKTSAINTSNRSKRLLEVMREELMSCPQRMTHQLVRVIVIDRLSVRVHNDKELHEDEEIESYRGDVGRKRKKMRHRAMHKLG